MRITKKVKVQKQTSDGSSYSITLPKQFAQLYGMGIGDTLIITLDTECKENILTIQKDSEN